MDDNRPNPLASVDAAMGLILDGFRWGVSQSQIGTVPRIPKFNGWVMPIDSCLADDEHEGYSGSSPAIALTIAAIKARAENGPHVQGGER